MARSIARCVVLAALMAAAVMATASANTLHAVSLSSNFDLDISATAASPSDLLASALGLRQPAEGGIVKNPFNPTKSAVLVVMDSHNVDLVVESKKHTAMVSLKSFESSVGSDISRVLVEQYGESHTLVAVSHNEEFVRATVQANSAAHGLYKTASGQFVDTVSAEGKTAWTFSETEVDTMLSSGALGNGATFDSTTRRLIISGVEVNLKDESVYALVSEALSALKAIEQSVQTDSEAVVAVVGLSTVARVPNAGVASAVVNALLSSLSNKLQGSLVLAAKLSSFSRQTTVPSYRLRRDVEDLAAGNSSGNGTNRYSPLDPAFVEHCMDYKCYCSVDSKGNPWDPETGCSTDCKETSDPTCQCIWNGCDCNSASVNNLLSQCKTCVDGYTLADNYCYVESDFPVAFNIIFWMGIALVISLSLTSWAIAGMDPGKDSVIYRMTSQRIKTQ